MAKKNIDSFSLDQMNIQGDGTGTDIRLGGGVDDKVTVVAAEHKFSVGGKRIGVQVGLVSELESLDTTNLANCIISVAGRTTLGDTGAGHYLYFSSGRPASPDGFYYVIGAGADDYFKRVSNQGEDQVYVRDDLSTTSIANGGVITVYGVSVVGDSGEDEIWIYRSTGRTLITLGTNYITGPGTDDYWEKLGKTSANPVISSVAVLQTSTTTDGGTAQLLGHTTAGDAGDPKQVIYHATGRSGITLGMFYLTGPGADDYWEFVDKSHINPMWAGANGDGTADDSTLFETLFDLSDDLDLWIDLAGREYQVTIELAVPHPTAVRVRNGKLTSTGAQPLYLNSASYNASTMHFKDVTFEGATYGVKLKSTYFMRFDNCGFIGSVAGVHSTGCFGSYFEACGFSSTCKYGYVGLGTAATTYDGDHTFESCIVNVTGIGFVFHNESSLAGPHGNRVLDCLQQAPASIKVYASNCGSSVKPLTIEGNYWETAQSSNVDASDIGLGTIDIADGSIAQFHDRSWVYLDNLPYGTAGVHDSRLHCKQTNQTLVESGTFGHSEIDTVEIYPGNYTVLNYDHAVNKVASSWKNAANIVLCARLRSWAADGYDTSVTNLFPTPASPASSISVQTGSPTITSVTAEPGVLTEIARIVGAVGETVLFSPTQMVNPNDTTKTVCMTLWMKASAATDMRLISRDISGGTTYFNVKEYWQPYVAIIPQNSINRNQFRLYFSEAGTVDVANVSITKWDNEREMYQFIESGKVACGGKPSYASPPMVERAADPPDPPEGQSVLWQSDGTGSGDDGDIMAKVTSASVTSLSTLLKKGGMMQLGEQGSAPSGIADNAIIFAEDNGSGKTRLMVQFGTGAAQQIAIEP